MGCDRKPTAGTAKRQTRRLRSQAIATSPGQRRAVGAPATTKNRAAFAPGHNSPHIDLKRRISPKAPKKSSKKFDAAPLSALRTPHLPNAQLLLTASTEKSEILEVTFAYSVPTFE
jgi:hypothetical protein